MQTQKIIINLIQDLATPHNNVLIAQFKGNVKVQLNLWYAIDQGNTLYKWAESITNEHFTAEIYGTVINWRFIKYCLTHRDEKFVIVGWANTNTRLLHLLYFLLRRPFNHWTDLPMNLGSDDGFPKRIVRWITYKLLRYSRSKVFCVGKPALDYMRKCGFPEGKLVNLPIFVEVYQDLSKIRLLKQHFQYTFQLDPNKFWLIAGSRLVRDKGYDLMLEAAAKLSPEIRKNLQVILVGSGPEEDRLKQQANELGLSSVVRMIPWLEIDQFKAMIAASDVFIHPARSESYGGTTLGMALGLPVIGSNGAGAAIDRIVHGVNGYLYPAEDTSHLACYIESLYLNPVLRQKMAAAAHATSLKWPPERGVQILLEHLI